MPCIPCKGTAVDPFDSLLAMSLKLWRDMLATMGPPWGRRGAAGATELYIVYTYYFHVYITIIHNGTKHRSQHLPRNGMKRSDYEPQASEMQRIAIVETRPQPNRKETLNLW